MTGACALCVLVHCLALETTIYALRSGEGIEERAESKSWEKRGQDSPWGDADIQKSWI